MEFVGNVFAENRSVHIIVQLAIDVCLRWIITVLGLANAWAITITVISSNSSSTSYLGVSSSLSLMLLHITTKNLKVSLSREMILLNISGYWFLAQI